MKNTTERIIELGGNWQGDPLFIRALCENNPPCPKHWYACITNNPGGNAPLLNPLGWVEELTRLVNRERNKTP